MQRLADELVQSDYVYWSSPVDMANLSGISSNTPIFQWDVDAPNNGTSGNYVAPPTSIMEVGKGYIIRVRNDSLPEFTASFDGVPNNGTINIDVFKSPSGALPAIEDRHYNLIGNPYPSSIDADSFLKDTDNDNIEGVVYIWSHSSPIGNFSNPFYENFRQLIIEMITSNIISQVPIPIHLLAKLPQVKDFCTSERCG